MARVPDLEEKIVRRKKIAILPFDQEWKSNFEEHMTKDMKKLYKELVDKIEEEKQTTQQVKYYKKEKKRWMEKILKLSDDANTNNNPGALVQLEEAKQEVLNINEQLDETQFILENLPKEIEKLNFDLLKETVALAYDDIKEGSGRTKKLMEEILELRKQLTAKWEEKLYLDNRVNDLYSYLHHTLGHEETDKLDRFYL